MADVQVKFCYLNEKKFTPGNKPRLNIRASETFGKDDAKKYINYDFTLWDDEAIYYNNILGDEEKLKGVVASFSGYITEINGAASKDGQKIYTSLRLNLHKAGNNSCFAILPTIKGGASKTTALDKDDF